MVAKALNNAMERVFKQLNADVVRLDQDDDKTYARRVLGRIPFHLHRPGFPTAGYKQIQQLFPLIFNEFMGKEGIFNLPEEDLVEVEAPQLPTSSREPVSDDRDEFVEDEESVEPIDREVLEKIEENQRCFSKHTDNEVEENMNEIMEDMLPCNFGEKSEAEKAVEKAMTLIRRCDENCKEMDPSDAIEVHDALYTFFRERNFLKMKQWSEEFNELMSVQREWLFDVSIEDWLAKHFKCYQGIRTLSQRLREIKKYFNYLVIADKAKEGDNEATAEALKMDNLPDAIRNTFMNQICEKLDDSHHHQAFVEKKFKKNIQGFHDSLKDMETEICQVCDQYTLRSEVSRKPPSELPVTADLKKTKECKVCRMCWKDILKGKMPPAAVVNNMEVEDVPDEILALNTVEMMMIQRIRMVQGLIHLRDIAGRKTSMRGRTGGLVMVPVAIEQTVDHVADVLPTTSNMVLNVKTPWKKFYVISMPRIVRALRWLKNNNPHYKDIKINEKFSFTLGQDIIFADEGKTQEDADKLILRTEASDSEKCHLLTQAHFDDVPLRDVMQKDNDSKTAEEKFRLKRDKFAPLSVDTEHVDELALVHIFPGGKNGYNQQRPVPMTLSKYVRSRLLNKHRRFGKSVRYLAAMQGLREQKRATECCGIQARVRKGTSGAALQREMKNDRFSSTLSCVTAKLRNYPSYWKECKLRLRSHIFHFGTPTWFLTLNPNEQNWPELHELYSKVTGKKIDGENIKDAISQDPSHFSRYWRRRVNNFFKHVLLADDGPLGKITHYFYRVEYQHRGTQHVHCLLWTENRPPADAAPSEVVEFLDRYVTARMPTAEEPELKSIIENSQQHWRKHTNTCMRRIKFRGKISTHCRFGFPRPVTRRTILKKDKGIVRFAGMNRKTYSLARDAHETMTNDYNSAITLAWNGNTDLQFIQSDARGVANYCSAYVTKGEKAKKNDAEMQEDISMSHADLNSAIMKKFWGMISQKECGVLEICDDLFGNHNFGFDCAHVFIPNDKSESRARILKPKSENEELAYMVNWADVHYPERVEEFKNASLYNMMTNFEVVRGKNAIPTTKKRAGKSNDSDDDEAEDDHNKFGDDSKSFSNDYHVADKWSPFYCWPNIENGNKCWTSASKTAVFRKKKQMVGRFYLPVFDEADLEGVEDYFRRLCVVFVPWTDEENMLKSYGKKTYVELFDSYMLNLRKNHRDAHDDMQKLLSNILGLQKQECESAFRLDAMKKAIADLHIDEEAEEEIELQNRTVDVEEHKKRKEGMNEGQRTIFDKIMDRIDDQASGKTTDNVSMFISGTAGTGKSFLINCLADELTTKYAKVNSSCRPAVVIAAPTGLAATSIRGSTIHSLFKLGVQKGADNCHEPLGDTKKDLQRALFSNVRLIIIDEISMCSNIMLMKVQRRLEEISGKTIPFGGYNIVVLGDLLQLPPVKAPHVFEALEAHSLRRIFGSMCLSINLWNIFKYAELVENMRQREALEFANVMGRVRIQAMTNEDVKLLEGRIIESKDANNATVTEMAKKFIEIQNDDPTAMALFPTNVEADDFNRMTMKQKSLETVVIMAHETTLDRSTISSRKSYQNSKAGTRPYLHKEFSIIRKDAPCLQKVDDTLANLEAPQIAAGMPYRLELAIGIRVMLRRNIDTAKSLVNGATGTLESMEKDANNVVSGLFVRFDLSKNRLTRIDRCSSAYEYSKDETRTRTQFPIVAAFAATMHKAQGLTLKNVMLSCRNIFAAGQFFVAASRVTSLEGLYLADFDKRKILTDVKACIEYNKLRRSIGLEAIDLPPKLTVGESRKSKRRSNATVTLELEEVKPPKQKKATPKATKRSARQFDTDVVQNSEEMESNAVFELKLPFEHVEAEKMVFLSVQLCFMMKRVYSDIFLIGQQPEEDEGIPRALLTLQQLLTAGHDKLNMLCADLFENGVKEKLSIDVALHKLFSAMPESVSRHVQFTSSTMRKCLTCHREKSSIENSTSLSVPFDKGVGKIGNCIDRLIVSKLEPDSCRSCKSSCNTSRTIDFGYGHRYLIVCNDSYRKFENFKKDGDIFLKLRWQLVGCIQYLESDEPAVVYAKEDGGYLRYCAGKLLNEPQLKGFAETDVFVFANKLYQRKTNARDEEKVKEIDAFNELIDEDDIMEIDFTQHKKNTIVNNFDGNEPETFNFDALELLNRPEAREIQQSRCFVISSLNLFYAAHHLRQILLTSDLREDFQDGLIESEENCSKLETLQLIFNKETTDCGILRRQLMPPHFHIGQHDASDVVNEIMEIIPRHMKELFGLRKTYVSECSGCNEKSERSEERFQINHVLTGSATFRDFAKDLESTEAKNCSNCNERTKMTTSRYVVNDATKYLVLHLPRGAEKIGLQIDEPLKSVSLFNRNWLLRAAIQYISFSNVYGASGHWVTYARGNNEVAKVNDNLISKSQFPPNLLDCTILLFEIQD